MYNDSTLRQPRILLEIAIGAAIAVAALAGLLSDAPGQDLGLIIGITLLAAKVLGNKADDGEDDVQGQHPITRFVFGAVNGGDFEDTDELVDDEFRAYANGYPMVVVGADHGPELLRTAFGYWREALPDMRWELYDEAAQKQEDKSEMLALRFVSTATIEDEARDIEMAGFARVIDRQLVELRLVLDMSVFNDYRRAAGLPAIE